jgi:hypothetical protein
LTAQRRTIQAATTQRAVIGALRAAGDIAVADRLERCGLARQGRRGDGGWPWTCRSAGCVWCGRALVRKWWLGLRQWISSSGGLMSLIVVRLDHHTDELRGAVQRLRRALRDVRDRAARRDRRWRSVCIAGMAGGGGAALVLVQHPPGLSRAEVGAVLRRRWPEVGVGDVGDAMPARPLAVVEMVELARLRRGVEPLRVVILAQREPARIDQGTLREGRGRRTLEPMPCSFLW